jgi:trk system potassium uptake protein TrkH
VGSTAGGIKLLRLLIVLRLLQLVLVRTALPRHAVVMPRIAGRRVGDAEITALLAFLSGLGLLVLASWIVFVAAGHPAFPAFLEVIAAVSTSGLSTGITGPDLAWHLKFLLIFDMLAGRLEIIALIILFYPATWIGRRRRGA